MSDVADYDADILLWSERQAALLRDLKARTRGLPNELDLENVAEEIESVGRSELGTASSQLANILVHLIKLAFSSNRDPVPHWLDEVRTFHDDLLQRISPSMHQRIDLDRIWRRASRRAMSRFADFDEDVPDLPSRCPFTLAEIIADDFEPKITAERLKEAAGQAGSK